MNQTDDSNGGYNRRDFIKGSSVATMMAMLGAVPMFAQAPAEQPAEKPEEKKPKKPPVKVGVIGLGPWGREILDTLGKMEMAKVASVCDNYGAFLRRASTKAPEAAAVEDYKAMLANKDVQAIIVATPTHLHKDIVIAALQAGKHVYCEAPLANTIEDAKAIALAAKNAAGTVFQSGLQMRCDPQRHWLMPFIRSGALGRSLMGRSQWHKKTSWRQESSNEERTKVINWRLDKKISTGLLGEIGIHQIDQAGWLFANARPVAVSGQGSILLYKDGRDVPDTVNLIVEYAGGVRLTYDILLGSSFDADYEVYHGSDAAVMIRDIPTQAWMFKEADAALGGWEVYARRDTFYKSTGIALVAGGSKQTALGSGGAAKSAFEQSTLYYALEAFLTNCAEMSSAIEDYASSGFDASDKVALGQYLATIKRPPIPADVSPTVRATMSVFENIPKHDAGYAATVLAIKANEAITKGTRIELSKEMFELA